MNGDAATKLYELLPAVIRIRDAEQGEPLKALLAVLAEQGQILEDDIARLHDSWYIETCDEWVAAYIADLLGVRGLHPIAAANFSLRSHVANTLAYRRRKGTPAVLEQLARDTTGWSARAVEYFELLATTQYLNHVRLSHPATADLRDTDGLDLLGGPFERAPRNAEVRHIDNARGKYNIPNVGLWLWRLQSYPITRVTARAKSKPPDPRYTFDPLGRDVPLFNQPQTEAQITQLAEEINVPGRLRRLPLYNELVARRIDLLADRSPSADYFGERPVFEVFLGGSSKPLKPENILICNLTGWDQADWKPPKSPTLVGPEKKPFSTQVAVDPVLGRLALLEGVPQDLPVEVTYAYGFSADLGGGPYNRQEAGLRELTNTVKWQVGVSKKKKAEGSGKVFDTLSAAVEEWNKQPAGTVGLIAIMDSQTYEEDLTGPVHTVQIPEGSHLVIIAADWPVIEDSTAPDVNKRVPGQFVPDQLRPHLRGDFSVKGTPAGQSSNPGQLTVNGLLIEGTLSVLVGNLGRLQLAHCTVVPNKGLKVSASATDKDKQNARLQVWLERCISGPITLDSPVPELHVGESIVDHGSAPAAISALDSNADIQTSTILGPTRVRSLEAGNSIFTEQVTATRRQTGCVRFSYVPKDSKNPSQTPRRYRCQPDLALLVAAQAKNLDSVDKLPASEQAVIVGRIKPQFTSTQFGDPRYVQLSGTCANEIYSGADDGSEMGAFSLLKQPQREANLRASLDEYLPVGLEAGLFFVT